MKLLNHETGEILELNDKQQNLILKAEKAKSKQRKAEEDYKLLETEVKTLCPEKFEVQTEEGFSVVKIAESQLFSITNQKLLKERLGDNFQFLVEVKYSPSKILKERFNKGDAELKDVVSVKLSKRITWSTK